MKKVVKKKILKWSDAEIINSIPNTSWVSVIECVPKKDRVTTVPNQNIDLIPTIIITG